MSKSKKKLLVIGAGLAGLGGAHLARKAGHDVEILEASDRPGGRARSIEHNGDRAAVGAQFFHGGDRVTHGLIEDMGLGDLRFTVHSRVAVRLPDGNADLHNRFAIRKLLGWGGRLSAAYFMARHFARGARFPMHELKAEIPDLDDRLVSEATANLDERFRRHVIFPIAYGFCESMPEHTSLLHLVKCMNLSRLREVGLPHGTVSLAEALAERLPVEYESPARRLIVEQGRVVGAELENGTARRADQVLVAVPADAAATLMPEELPELRTRLAEVPGKPQVVLAFFMDRPIPGKIGAYFDLELDPDQSFCLAMDQAYNASPMVPSGRSLIVLYSAYPKSLELIQQPDDALLKLGLEALHRMVPDFQEQWVERSEIVRHPWCLAHFPPGQYKRNWELQCLAEKQPGLALADVSGDHIEASLRRAEAGVARMQQE